MNDPFEIIRMFEDAVCEYTGAPYCVATTSCTTALLLSLSWYKNYVWNQAIEADMLAYHITDPHEVSVPRKTYVGVPQAVLHSGFRLKFKDENWSGSYRLDPFPVWDYARRFTSGMYIDGQMQCVSFGWSKILAIGQGGAILHDDKEADEWLRHARFDGRTEGVPADQDNITHLGYHAYMMPRDAAEGLSRLAVLPEHNEDLPLDNYPDLSQMDVFKKWTY